MSVAAILPSRDEPSTIAAVTTAVDTALNDEQAVIVHADSSAASDTAERFALTPTRARKVCLTHLLRGKGAQVLTAARRPEIAGADAVLIADTDTRNPDPAMYRPLLEAVGTGACLAVADYPRYWDEANLTSHLARPLIAAATGNDVPQPLAGDLALTGAAVVTALAAADTLDTSLTRCLSGYGVDAFLLLSVAAQGPVTSVRLNQPKQHAGSFPHLPAIYHEAVPILLHLTAAWPPPASGDLSTVQYRTWDRAMPPAQLAAMLAVLDDLTRSHLSYGEHPWPLPLAHAWRAVNSGALAHDAAHRLWPHYLNRVHTWLTLGQDTANLQRAAMLATAHSHLHTVLSPAGAPG